MLDTRLTALECEVPITMAPKLFWFEYRQNNSGGRFITDDDVAKYVLIQETDAGPANHKAEQVGIYFDGCNQGWDCDCCGDRWNEVGDPLDDFSTSDYKNNWTRKVHDNVIDYAKAIAAGDTFSHKGENSVIVYFADGHKEIFKG